MITELQALVLGAVQGLTEFLPVSSSAHLVLVPWLFGWNDPGLAFDVALHLGSLLALLGSITGVNGSRWRSPSYDLIRILDGF